MSTACAYHDAAPPTTNSYTDPPTVANDAPAPTVANDATKSRTKIASSFDANFLNKLNSLYSGPQSSSTAPPKSDTPKKFKWDITTDTGVPAAPLARRQSKRPDTRSTERLEQTDESSLLTTNYPRPFAQQSSSVIYNQKFPKIPQFLRNLPPCPYCGKNDC